ncbi:hypothetical protein L208DRAFT_387319 [Tricholoma matsutake]|nr:hypothetical protein L208DRAFT_387319 [Tricholoma matsutake 945]
MKLSWGSGHCWAIQVSSCAIFCICWVASSHSHCHSCGLVLVPVGTGLLVSSLAGSIHQWLAELGAGAWSSVIIVGGAPQLLSVSTSKTTTAHMEYLWQ